jgi:hypothetical protein
VLLLASSGSWWRLLVCSRASRYLLQLLEAVTSWLLRGCNCCTLPWEELASAAYHLLSRGSRTQAQLCIRALSTSRRSCTCWPNFAVVSRSTNSPGCGWLRLLLQERLLLLMILCCRSAIVARAGRCVSPCATALC